MSLKRLCTICARGGSKGVVGKNIRPLLGQPMLTYSIEQARASGLFEAIAVSSDSPEILAVAEQWGADYCIVRPAELATDTAGKAPAIRHCVETVENQTNMKFDVLVDLDATAPLRLVDDIVGAVSLLEVSRAKNVITGSPSRRSPYFNLVEQDPCGRVDLCKKSYTPFLRRQDVPKTYDMNASIYVWWRDPFMENPAVFTGDTQIYVMPEERSHDVDTELDFIIVEFLMNISGDMTERKDHEK